ncbi:zinc finger protein 334 [Rhinolophus ferrumequinum]|uniref:Zinc finger protein 334 n=1 Tax=Rhinolophus ferrumequinum TaxID=59479 RepID=A0A7J7SAC7_RHIFE|nr:zinc finger protein 334 [Rhinolophus ferrumequinum]
MMKSNHMRECTQRRIFMSVMNMNMPSAKTQHLVEHQRTIWERPYESNKCERTCCQKAALTHHQRTHTEADPASVVYVGKPAGSSPSLNISEFTSWRSYECNECGKSCHQLAFRVHWRSHTREKPFEGIKCGKT